MATNGRIAIYQEDRVHIRELIGRGHVVATELSALARDGAMITMDGRLFLDAHVDVKFPHVLCRGDRVRLRNPTELGESLLRGRLVKLMSVPGPTRDRAIWLVEWDEGTGVLAPVVPAPTEVYKRAEELVFDANDVCDRCGEEVILPPYTIRCEFGCCYFSTTNADGEAFELVVEEDREPFSYVEGQFNGETRTNTTKLVLVDPKARPSRVDTLDTVHQCFLCSTESHRLSPSKLAARAAQRAPYVMPKRKPFGPRDLAR